MADAFDTVCRHVLVEEVRQGGLSAASGSCR
jgi:hypothetical protein